MESSLSLYSANPLTPARAYTTYAAIDLGRLRHNARILKKMAGPAEIMAVVKANAYGHGAPHITRVLQEEGYRYFMVATLSEAVHLRKERIYAPIMIATPPLPENLPVYSELGFHVSASTPETCRAVIQHAHSGLPLDVHVKLETGLNRLGISVEEARAFMDEAARQPSIVVRGIWTHLATAGHEDTTFARHQFKQVQDFISHYPAFDGYVHVGNTSSLIHRNRYIKPQPNTMYRSGGGLLGISAIPDRAREVGLLPIMSLKSHVLAIKAIQAGDSVSYGRTWTSSAATRIAVIGSGYADGYPGSFKGRVPRVTIQNQHYPIVGKVCMDMCMADLGDDSTVQPGDEVILFGEGGIDISTLATLSGQKAYEISCGISQRVVKTYK